VVATAVAVDISHVANMKADDSVSRKCVWINDILYRILKQIPTRFKLVKLF